MKIQTLILAIALSFIATALPSSCSAQEQTTSAGSHTEEGEGIQDTENASCSKYGPDSLATLDAASIFYYDYAAQNDPDQMIKGRAHYVYVLKNAPGYDRAFIASGLPIYRHLADLAETPESKQAYIDTLFGIYKTLISCYDKDGYYYGRMGYDMMKYMPKDYDAIQNAFANAIRLSGNQTEYFILYPYMRLISQEYKSGLIDKDEVFKIYEKIVNIAEHNIESNYLADRYQQTLESIQAELKASGVLDCENLKPYFLEKLAAAPDDIELIKKVYGNLSTCDMCDEDLLPYWKKLFEAEPTVKLARILAECSINQNRASEALVYFDKAIELEPDSIKKAELAYKAGIVLYGKVKNFPKARAYAYKALKYRPNWGEPYILIGRLYASSGSLCGSGTGWRSQVVVWPAIDKWEQAKRVDPSVAAEANKWINKYTQYMPGIEEIFNRGLNEGDPFTIDWCWIKETTKIRAKP